MIVTVKVSTLVLPSLFEHAETSSYSNKYRHDFLFELGELTSPTAKTGMTNVWGPMRNIYI